MGWAVQHMRVTLEDAATGEVVVIEEGQAANDAKAKEAKAAAAAEEAKAREAKAKKEAKAKDEEARAKEVKAKEEARAKAKAKEEAKAKETKEKEAKPKSKPRSSKKPALAWRAVKDNNYDGFAAKVRLGEFKALHARNTQWALFFERKDTYPAHLGCFSKLEQAKARAQELHDAGWPESEFGDVTREMVERACPVPTYEREEKPEMKRVEPVEPEKPATPAKSPKAEKPPKEAEPTEDKPTPPSPSPEQKSTDEILSRSFMEGVRALVDEDEDD